MLKKTIKYIDFDGQLKEKEVYFNLTEPEVFRLDAEYEGGLIEYISQINENVEQKKILELFERLLTYAYGEKTEDAQYFIKSEEKRQMWSFSAAYNALFMELIQDVGKATEFFNQLLGTSAIVPVDTKIK